MTDRATRLMQVEFETRLAAIVREMEVALGHLEAVPADFWNSPVRGLIRNMRNAIRDYYLDVDIAVDVDDA